MSSIDKLMVGGSILEKKIHFDAKGPAKSQLDNQMIPDGYFEVTIPHAQLGSNYTVLVNNATTTDYHMTYNRGSVGDQNGDSTTIAFNYGGITIKSIDILGTTAIPEFPLAGENVASISAATVSILGIMLIAIMTLSRSRMSKIQQD